MERYKTEWVNKNAIEGQQEDWVFRMINTKRPLEEKIALFWHGILCTGPPSASTPGSSKPRVRYVPPLMAWAVSGTSCWRLAIDPAMIFYPGQLHEP